MLNKQIPRIGTVLLAAVAVALLVLAPGAPAAHRAGAATLCGSVANASSDGSCAACSAS